MFEVEAKIPLADSDSLVARLRELGAQDRGTSHQEDTYFAHPSRDFASTDEALRLRRVDGAVELTYKGPKQAGAIKSRQEENVQVTGDADALLAGLGFTQVAAVSKTRWSWQHGAAIIAIDDVSGVGSFVEVEATGEDVPAAQRIVRDGCSQLGLDLDASVTESYLEMLLAKQE